VDGSRNVQPIVRWRRIVEDCPGTSLVVDGFAPLNRSLLPADQELSDLELLAATASGKSSAFEVLYERYERRVFNYVRTFLRQSTIAEDVVIDTMTAVWHGARNFTQASRVSTWIFGIARHKALDAVRKAGSHPDPLPLDQSEEPIDTDEDPSATMEHGHTAQLMLRAIARLSEDHREILRLAFYEDLPYEEIATLLSIPDNTVKTRVFYAKQQLRRHLERLGVGSAS
jgi:RNA polymerase sigma-70 factor, ECF subfamily